MSGLGGVHTIVQTECWGWLEVVGAVGRDGMRELKEQKTIEGKTALLESRGMGNGEWQETVVLVLSLHSQSTDSGLAEDCVSY